MTLQQTIIRDLATLDEGDLTQVAQYLSFLKFRVRVNRQPNAAPQDQHRSPPGLFRALRGIEFRRPNLTASDTHGASSRARFAE